MRVLTRTAFVALITLVFSAAAIAQYSQPVRDVENPARTPFWGYAFGTIDVNWVNNIFNVGTIPVGQRLVIEHVAVHCAMSDADSILHVTITVYKKSNGGWASWQIPLLSQKQGLDPFTGKISWLTSQQVRLYSDGVSGANVGVSVSRSFTGASASCWATVSGHTISTP